MYIYIHIYTHVFNLVSCVYRCVFAGLDAHVVAARALDQPEDAVLRPLVPRLVLCVSCLIVQLSVGLLC